MPIRVPIALAFIAASRFTTAQTHHTPAPRPRQIVVGYFGQWGVYDQVYPNRLTSLKAPVQLDQINYAQGFVTSGRCSIADPNADLLMAFNAHDAVNGRADSPSSHFRGDLHQLAELKQLHPHLRVLISLEGRASDFAFDARPENRSAFIASCIDVFIRGQLAPGISQPHLFDGIDMDWEYPHDEDASNFLALLHELRAAMDLVRRGLKLSVAVGPSPRMYPRVDLKELGRIVDQVGAMNYDYHGPWNPTTNFIAPLYSDTGGSVAGSIAEWLDAGIPKNRLLMGLPFYGYGWEDVPGTNHGLLQSGTPIRGDRPWMFFAPLVAAASHSTQDSQSAQNVPSAVPPPTAPASGSPGAGALRATPGGLAPGADMTPPPSANFVLYRDPASQAPWLYNGSTFWTFEDQTSIHFKAAFARDQRLAGVMIWELGEDCKSRDLIRAATLGLRPEPRLPVPKRRRNGRDD